MKLIYILIMLSFARCSNKKTNNCIGVILDLKIDTLANSENKLISYHKTNSFELIQDTNQLLRFETPERISHFFQLSSIDSSKKKYTYKVKEAIILSDNYQLDLLALIDNDQKMDNVIYWVKTYDRKRNQIGHLDFAYWSGEKKIFNSGRIDCDSTLHMILNDRNQHRIFTIDKTGKILFKESNTIN